MSLRVWLPLTGDFTNLGLDDIIVTNQTASAWEDGKIGKALKTLNSYYYFTIPSLIDKNIFSASFWYKCNDTSTLTTNWRRILGFVTKDQPIATSTGLLRFESSYGNNYAISVHSNAAYQIMPSGTGNRGLVTTKGEWHHVALSCNGNIINIYIDGVLFNSGAQTTGVLSGQARICETGNQADGWINDVRIYDHALSQKEVKQISKALIAHYPLNDYIANPNLVPNLGQYNSEKNAYVATSNRVDGAIWITDSAFEVKPSTTYTISLCSDGILSNQHGANGMTPEQKPFSFWIYCSNNGTQKNWKAGSYDTPRNFTSANNNYRKIGNKHVWTYTTTASERYFSLRVNNYSDGSTNLSIKYWCFKIEQGDKLTPWIPHVTDSIYEKLELPSKTNLLSPVAKSITPTSYLGCQFNMTKNLEAGKTYTLQLWDVNVSHNNKANAAVGIWVYWGGGSVHLFNWNIYNVASWNIKYLSHTFTVTEAQASGNGATNAWFNIYNSVGYVEGTMNLTIGKWKLEQGSIATDWNDGTDSTVIYDTSGYHNNGINSGGIVSFNTPRYNTSLKFKEPDDKVTIGNSEQLIAAHKGDRTTTCWVYQTEEAPPLKYIFRGQSSSGNYGFYFYNSVFALSWGNTGINIGGIPIIPNQWNFIVVKEQYPNSLKIYTNNILKHSENQRDYTTKQPSDDCIWTIGGSPSNSTNTDVYISDFRVYATALSEEDIKELYQTSASIDKDGNIWSYQYIETEQGVY